MNPAPVTRRPQAYPPPLAAGRPAVRNIQTIRSPQFLPVDPGPGPQPTDPPRVERWEPTPGTVLGRYQAVGFDLVNDSARSATVLVSIAYPDGTVDVALEGGQWRGEYSGNATDIPDGRRFRLQRRGGWLAAPTIRVSALPGEAP